MAKEINEIKIEVRKLVSVYPNGNLMYGAQQLVWVRAAWGWTLLRMTDYEPTHNQRNQGC